MKTSALLITITSLCASGLCAPRAISTRIVERDSNHEIVESIRPAANGTTIITNHYTRIGNGLNYKDELGQWVAARPNVQSFSQGIICTGASYQVIIATNLNVSGAVQLLTSDKKELISSPLGIALYDPESGKNVLIAQITNCQAELISSNEILYADAFQGSGIQASIVYRYDVGHFSQDMKLLKQPTVNPADFGMGSRTRLEILTEFQRSPIPNKTQHVLNRETNPTLRATMVEPDIVDERLNFGEMWMESGRAFHQDRTDPQQPPNRGIRVAKQWTKIDGRTILIESVPWDAANAQWSETLKQSDQPTSHRRADSKFQLPKHQMARTDTSPFKARLAQITGSPAKALVFGARNGVNLENAFVMDYTLVEGGGPITTFSSGETYMIPYQATCYGEVQFNSGAILKYGSFAGLNVEGHISGLFFGGPPVVFTSINDDSIGETNEDSTGFPQYSAAYALAWESYGDQHSYLGPADFRYCYGAVSVDDTSGYNLYLISPSFEDTSWCINNGGNVDLVSTGPMSVCNVNMIAQGNVTIDSLSNCDPNADTDGDGLADNWEVTYFHNLSHSGAEDSDGDGLTNLREYQYGSNPAVVETDSDSDGMADWWENLHGLAANDGTGLNGAAGDPDADGVSNLQEYLGGTNPVEPNNPLALPATGSTYMKVLSSELLELVRITQDSNTWNFSLTAPGTNDFQVKTNGVLINNAVQQVGYKRRALYAPLLQTAANQKIENSVYLKLSDSAIADNSHLQVTYTPENLQFLATKDPLRYSPAIHVNQEGYFAATGVDRPKKATVGYFVGNLEQVTGYPGEMKISPSIPFSLVNTANGQVVYNGSLSASPRSDSGWPTDDSQIYQPQYQRVYEADFSTFGTVGQYVMQVQGLGASLPFRIDDGIAMKLARAYALGIYHQRCGGNGDTSIDGEQGNKFPFTLYVHSPCHTNPASIPKSSTQFPTAASIAFIEETLRVYSGAYNVLLVTNLDRVTDTNDNFPDSGTLLIAIGKYKAGNQDLRTFNTLYFRVFDSAGVMRFDGHESSISGHSTQILNLKTYLSPLWAQATLTGDQKRTISDDPTASFSTSRGVRAIVAPAGETDLWPDGASSGENPPQIAPRMQTLSNILSAFKFVRAGTVDVSKGHHDAGDYSKYTLSSVQFIHSLVFAADNFAGVSNLDNLGIPESGNGKCDLLDLAKWEADFLVKMQDTDGGFYFLVYPETREYETDKLPQNGDHQIVFPKTSSATAAAVAALAEIGSSRKFCSQFGYSYNDWVNNPYLKAAVAGWSYLTNQIGANDQNKAAIYQKITHYGDEFTHDDELAWAAAAMFAASGNDTYFQKLFRWYPHPNAANGANGYTIQWIRSGTFPGVLPSSGNLLAVVGYAPNTLNVNDTSHRIYFRVFDANGNMVVDRNDVVGDSKRILEARDKLVDIKKFLNGWAVQHPTVNDDPYLIDRVSALVGFCHGTLRFGWQHMTSCYGCAIRAYAYAVNSGRLDPSLFSPAFATRSNYLTECNAEIAAAASDVRTWSSGNAYGSSFPFASKNYYVGGWYFSSDLAFDAATANQLTPNSANTSALIENLNYEAGRNPVNTSYITGLGWRRQREIVHQYAQNDDRVLPPSGIPLGNIADGILISQLEYLNGFWFPANGWGTNSFGLYDRWADTYNLKTEFVSFQSARALGVAALLAAQTSLKTQPWRSTSVSVSLPNQTAVLNTTVVPTVVGFDVSDAQVVFQLQAHEPSFGSITPTKVGDFKLEMEAVKPDGRRVFALDQSVLVYDPVHGGTNNTVDGNTIALYRFDGNLNDSSGNNRTLTGSGNVTYARASWAKDPTGNMVARFGGAGNFVQVTGIPDSVIEPIHGSSPLTIDARIFPRAYNFGQGEDLLTLRQDWNSVFGAYYDLYKNPDVPEIIAPGDNSQQSPTNYPVVVLTNSEWSDHLSLNTWHNLRITFAVVNGHATNTVYIDGVFQKSMASPPPQYSSAWTLTIGNFDGDVDEVRISKVDRGALP
jgi:hypothetical protein